MSDPAVFTVAKADPIGKEPIPGAVLKITAELARVRETLPHAIWRASCLSIHELDARQVVAALANLPQGTLDQVLLLLLQQYGAPYIEGWNAALSQLTRRLEEEGS